MELIFFQYFLYCFLAGLAVGTGILALGIIIGKFLDRGSLLRPKEEPFNPESPPMDDEFFEKALRDPGDGGHDFPTDAQLEELHRNSL